MDRIKKEILAIVFEAQDRLSKLSPNLRIKILALDKSHANYRPNWLNKWGYRVPGAIETRAECELPDAKEIQEFVERVLQERRNTVTESVKESAEDKNTGFVSRLKNLFKTGVSEEDSKPTGDGNTRMAESASESLKNGTPMWGSNLKYTKDEIANSLVEQALRDRKDAGSRSE